MHYDLLLGGALFELGTVDGMSKNEFATFPISLISGGYCTVYFLSMDTSGRVNSLKAGVTPFLEFCIPKE